MCGNSGCLGHGFEATLALLNVLLWVEDDDIDFGDVQHAQRHRGTQAHGHSQRGGLNEHLVQGGKKIKSNILAWPQLRPITSGRSAVRALALHITLIYTHTHSLLMVTIHSLEISIISVMTQRADISHVQTFQSVYSILS